MSVRNLPQGIPKGVPRPAAELASCLYIFRGNWTPLLAVGPSLSPSGARPGFLPPGRRHLNPRCEVRVNMWAR
jgi:hypothetical protein